MNTFFPSMITEWNKLDLIICNTTSLNIFKGKLLQFVRPLKSILFTCHNPIGIKYLTRLRLGFSHLRYHKFKHSFLDAVDPLCSCNTAFENTVHYFLHCPNSTKYISQWNHYCWQIPYWSRWNQNYSNVPLWKPNLFCQCQKKVNFRCKYKVFFGNQKIWQNNFLGKRVMVNA